MRILVGAVCFARGSKLLSHAAASLLAHSAISGSQAAHVLHSFEAVCVIVNFASILEGERRVAHASRDLRQLLYLRQQRCAAD